MYTLKNIRIIFCAIFLCLAQAQTAQANTEEFISLLNAQDSLIKKSMVCYRIWSINSATFELGLKQDIRQNNPRAKKSARSLYQTHARVLFLEELAKKEGLKKLMDAGYSAGEGMNHLKEKDIIKKDCTTGVNLLMNNPEYNQLKESAYKKSQAFVNFITQPNAAQGATVDAIGSSKDICYFSDEILAEAVFNFFAAQGMAAINCDALANTKKHENLSLEVFEAHKETSKNFTRPLQSFIARNGLDNNDYMATLGANIQDFVNSSPLNESECRQLYEEMEQRKEDWGRIIGQVMAELVLTKDNKHKKCDDLEQTGAAE